jgi:hypothetical protein
MCFNNGILLSQVAERLAISEISKISIKHANFTSKKTWPQILRTYFTNFNFQNSKLWENKNYNFTTSMLSLAIIQRATGHSKEPPVWAEAFGHMRTATSLWSLDITRQ